MRETAREAHSPTPLPRLVHLAVERIEAGALEEETLESLARGLGVTSRQLRRAMRAALGLAPVALAQAQRLARARQLLERSGVTVTEAAFASGFGSLRRFNAIFAQAYGQAPSRVRRSRREPVETVLFDLSCQTPFDWPAMLRKLRARAIPSVEHIGGLVYARTVLIGAHRGWVAVSPGRSPRALCAEASLALSRALPVLVPRLRRLLRLDGPENPQAPGDFEEFEASFRNILGGHSSSEDTRARAGRLASACGETFELPYAPLTRLLPTAANLSQLTETDFIRLGIGASRARRLLSLARTTLAKEEK